MRKHPLKTALPGICDREAGHRPAGAGEEGRAATLGPVVFQEGRIYFFLGSEKQFNRKEETLSAWVGSLAKFGVPD